MKCEKCGKDKSYFGELNLNIYHIKGFQDQLIKIKRLVCNECHLFYSSISQ